MGATRTNRNSGIPTAGSNAKPVHVVVVSAALPEAPDETESVWHTWLGSQNTLIHTSESGPPGTMSVPSSFSQLRQRFEAHRQMTPAIQPTNGMSEPMVSSSTAASSSPVPAGRSMVRRAGDVAPPSETTISSGVPRRSSMVRVHASSVGPGAEARASSTWPLISRTSSARRSGGSAWAARSSRRR